MRLFGSILGMLLSFAPAISRADTVTVFAAASLKNALDDVSALYENGTGTAVQISYAGSAALARQIAFGAPADVFVSANTQWMDWLDQEGLVLAERRADLLENQLVMVAPSPAKPNDPAELIGPADHIAMALYDAVPAGIYGKQALQYLELWQDALPRVVQTDNVRAALALVARQEVALGVVYHTDALADPSVNVVHRFAEGTHDPIRYPAALTLDAGPEAGDFLQFLQQDAAREVFESHGFIAVGGDG